MNGSDALGSLLSPPPTPSPRGSVRWGRPLLPRIHRGQEEILITAELILHNCG